MVADAFVRTSGNDGILGYEDLDGVNSFIEVAYEFDNGMTHIGKILAREEHRVFAVEYFGGSTARFELEPHTVTVAARKQSIYC